MMWALLVVGWLLVAFLAGPVVGRFLKHYFPTDAPTGQIGEQL